MSVLRTANARRVPGHRLGRIGVGERNRRALCIVLMPVASDVEEPATDVDAAGEGLPINEVFYSLQGEGTLGCPPCLCGRLGVTCGVGSVTRTIRRGSRPGRGATSTRSLRRFTPTSRRIMSFSRAESRLSTRSPSNFWNDWLQTGIIRRRWRRTGRFTGTRRSIWRVSARNWRAARRHRTVTRRGG